MWTSLYPFRMMQRWQPYLSYPPWLRNLIHGKCKLSPFLWSLPAYHRVTSLSDYHLTSFNLVSYSLPFQPALIDNLATLFLLGLFIKFIEITNLSELQIYRNYKSIGITNPSEILHWLPSYQDTDLIFHVLFLTVRMWIMTMRQKMWKEVFCSTQRDISLAQAVILDPWTM